MIAVVRIDQSQLNVKRIINCDRSILTNTIHLRLRLRHCRFGLTQSELANLCSSKVNFASSYVVRRIFQVCFPRWWISASCVYVAKSFSRSRKLTERGRGGVVRRSAPSPLLSFKSHIRPSAPRLSRFFLFGEGEFRVYMSVASAESNDDRLSGVCHIGPRNRDQCVSLGVYERCRDNLSIA